jgi:hypothetical protein
MDAPRDQARGKETRGETSNVGYGKLRHLNNSKDFGSHKVLNGYS